uniref:Protein RIC1 homolog n=1 Tax=Heterorhabditis bacteriophora TaxID=37862 RepID=A0A1I7WBN5_HETBA
MSFNELQSETRAFTYVNLILSLAHIIVLSFTMLHLASKVNSNSFLFIIRLLLFRHFSLILCLYSFNSTIFQLLSYTYLTYNDYFGEQLCDLFYSNSVQCFQSVTKTGTAVHFAEMLIYLTTSITCFILSIVIILRTRIKPKPHSLATYRSVKAVRLESLIRLLGVTMVLCTLCVIVSIIVSNQTSINSHPMLVIYTSIYHISLAIGLIVFPLYQIENIAGHFCTVILITHMFEKGLLDVPYPDSIPLQFKNPLIKALVYRNMYIPVDREKKFRLPVPAEDGDLREHRAVKYVTANREKIFVAVVTADSIYIWLAQPHLLLCMLRISAGDVIERGTLSKAYWNYDSTYIAITTSRNHILIYRVDVTGENCYSLIDPFDSNFRRTSQELFLRGQRPAVALSPSVVINLAAPSTCQTVIVAVSDFTMNINMIMVLNRNNEENIVTAEFISDASVHIVEAVYAPLIGGYCAVFSDGRAALLTSSDSRFHPNSLLGVWALNMKDACCTDVNHKFRLLIFGCKNGDVSAYHLDDANGALVQTFRIALTVRNGHELLSRVGSVSRVQVLSNGGAIAAVWSSRDSDSQCNGVGSTSNHTDNLSPTLAIFTPFGAQTWCSLESISERYIFFENPYLITTNFCSVFNIFYIVHLWLYHTHRLSGVQKVSIFGLVVQMGCQFKQWLVQMNALVTFDLEGNILLHRLKRVDDDGKDGGIKVSLDRLAAIRVDYLITHPACLVSIQLTQLSLDSGTTTFIPGVDTVLVNVSGRLLTLNPKNTSKDDAELNPPIMVASFVEQVWHDRAVSDEDSSGEGKESRHLSNALWINCGSKGMRVFVHHLLRQLLKRNLGVFALEVAAACRRLAHFPHSLELLLHGVLEEEATSSEPIPDPLLPRCVAFIQEFPEFLRTVAHCARKTELALWSSLFAVTGSPNELFEVVIAKPEYGWNHGIINYITLDNVFVFYLKIAVNKGTLCIVLSLQIFPAIDMDDMESPARLVYYINRFNSIIFKKYYLIWISLNNQFRLLYVRVMFGNASFTLISNAKSSFSTVDSSKHPLNRSGEAVEYINTNGSGNVVLETDDADGDSTIIEEARLIPVFTSGHSSESPRPPSPASSSVTQTVSTPDIRSTADDWKGVDVLVGESNSRGTLSCHAQMTHMLSLFADAGCIDWVFLICVISRDVVRIRQEISVETISRCGLDSFRHVRFGCLDLIDWAKQNCLGYVSILRVFATHLDMVAEQSGCAILPPRISVKKISNNQKKANSGMLCFLLFLTTLYYTFSVTPVISSSSPSSKNIHTRSRTLRESFALPQRRERSRSVDRAVDHAVGNTDEGEGCILM